MVLVLVLKGPCLGLAAESVVHLAFSLRIIGVSSRSWDRMTKPRMYLIISVKAVFIPILCLGCLAFRFFSAELADIVII